MKPRQCTPSSEPRSVPGGRLLFVVNLWILLLLLPALRAQTAAAAERQVPRLGYVYPAGGMKGSSFRVALGGQHLSDKAVVSLTGAGVTVRVIELFRPLTQQEFNKMRERAEELRNKAGISKDAKDAKDIPAGALEKLSEAERGELRELRRRMNEGNPRRQANPAIAETLLVELTLAPDAPEGTRELRVSSSGGLSNPMVFRVGSLPEYCAEPVEAHPTPKKLQADQRRAVARNETQIQLPAVVNGQILQGGVDRFRFKARKGQRLVFAAEARALIPYLADAVPGWFQATLTLSDAKGRELAYNDDFRFNPDPVLLFEVPADGEYMVDVKDGIFRGREDFIYRVSIGELPFVTGLFPAGGASGAKTAVDVSGWNLQQVRAQMDGTGRSPGRLLLSLSRELQASAPVPFELSEDPELLETEANDTPATAQPLSLPVVVNGRIGSAEDKDWFRFEGRAGEELVVELMARRLNSPLDSQLRLLDAQGRQIAFNDDHEDRGSGLTTHHADSYLLAKLPADGSYRIELSDVQHQGGEACVYRLHVHEPRPRFELRCEPSAINVREGEPAPITVYVLRRDGFTGPIKLAVNAGGLPISLDAGEIPAGQDKLRLSLSTRLATRAEPFALSITGTAPLKSGKVLTREAVPCDDMMQAFIYRHLVVAQTQQLQVLPKLPQRPPLRIVEKGPVSLRMGKETHLFVPVPKGRGAESLRFELSEAPEGLSVAKLVPAAAGVTIVLSCDATKAKAGQRGNLLFNAFYERQQKEGKGKPARRVPIGVLPALAYEVQAGQAPQPQN